MIQKGKPLYYGWWIAAAAAIGTGLGGPPILVFCFPVFLKALTHEFHASRSAISLAFTLHNVASALAAPFVGRLLDRIGVRKFIVGGTLLLALLLIGNSFITVSVAGIYAFNILGGIFGQGSGPIPYSKAVSNWFDRYRGTALALMMVGLGSSAMVMPSIVQRIISMMSWRAAYALYGGAIFLIALPVLAAAMKDTPAELGLFPDGSVVPPSVNVEGPEGLTLQEARRSGTFWLLIAAVVLLSSSVHACVMHLAAMLTDEGMSAQTAALASSMAGLGLLGGRVITGFLLDRYFGARVAMCFSASAVLGAVLLLITRSGSIPFLAAFCIGLGMGAEGDLIAYLTSRYFGLRSFGEIYGFIFGSFVLAGASGAFLMGFGFDRTGSYTAPLIGFVVAIFAAIVLFSRLGPYRYVVVTPFAEIESLQRGATAGA